MSSQLVLFTLERLAEAPWRALLSPAERSHADSLEGRKRIRYVNARIALRVTVSDLLGCGSAMVSMDRDGRGQVSVTAPIPLFVSLTYGERLGMAVVATCQVGIDYESGPAPVFWQSAMRRYLCDCERHWLLGLDEATQAAAFVALWTRREACLKCLGSGIRGACICLCALPAGQQLFQRRFSLDGGTGTLASTAALEGLHSHYLALDNAPGPADCSVHWQPAPQSTALPVRPG